MTTEVTVVDAVMGTGKSTWVTLMLKQTEQRSIIVLPRLTEVERYEKLLDDTQGVISLGDDQETSKKERFVDALTDAQLILITHSLFENYLTPETFEIIREGDWSLVMDEVITAFGPIKDITHTDIAGLVGKGVISKESLTDKVTKLVPNSEQARVYKNAPSTEASKTQKKFVEAAEIKDVLVVETQNQSTRDFLTFSLREERLNAFKKVTVLTYPFKETDLDYWFQINGWEVKHLRLTRNKKTNSLGDYSLEPHDGIYSGEQFAELIELVGGSNRKQAEKSKYGYAWNQLSARDSKSHLLCKDNRNPSPKTKEIRNDLRREFRNQRDRKRFADPTDFMFTCLKDCISTWRDPKKSLTAKFISEENWVPYNERGVNKYSHIHNLAFLYNVFPQPQIEKTVQAFGLEYNKERYALFILIQWIWRSAIREGEKIRLYLPSRRMRVTLQDWLGT